MHILKYSIKDYIICLLPTEDLRYCDSSGTLSVGLLICSALKTSLLFTHSDKQCHC